MTKRINTGAVLTILLSFAIHMGGSDVVHLSETRILITDIDENRFEIPDVTALTPGERKKLDLFL